MAENKKTLACLKAYLIAEDAAGKPGDVFRTRPPGSGTFRAEESYRVMVAHRFVKWVMDRPPPNVRIHDVVGSGEWLAIDFSDARTRRLLMVDGIDLFAKYRTGTLIHTHNGLRRVGSREGEEGWGVSAELRHTDADSRDLLHWITQEDRREHVSTHHLSGSSLVFSFTSPAHDFEFKNRFSV